jgi:hypothetical protein
MLSVPVFQVGEYYLALHKDDKVWISNTDEEGGEFPLDKFEEAIRDFFNANF